MCIYGKLIIMNKEELIQYLKKIKNIEKYNIKGGTSKFNKEHPLILNEINEMTNEIQKYSLNKSLPSKLLYLIKYNGNIKTITRNGKLMIYDRNLRDFKIANQNAAQKQWNDCKNELNNILEHYSKEETINKLKPIYRKYLGKSGNRKLLKDDKKLFLSIYYHTSNMNFLNKNFKKFSMRIFILLNEYDIYCSKHKTLKFWKFNNGIFEIKCNKCNPQYPSIDWFKHKYEKDWEIELNNRRNKLKKIKTNSLNWFINKYGDENGKIQYEKSVYNKISNLTKLNNNKYSKISQTLFWDIYKSLDNIDNVYFHDLNQEFVIRIPKNLNYKKTVMIVDFIQGKNIIEYNGEYWHNKLDDEIRKNILIKMGYNVLYISSNEYNRNKKDESIINKCIKFLTC